MLEFLLSGYPSRCTDSTSISRTYQKDRIRRWFPCLRKHHTYEKLSSRMVTWYLKTKIPQRRYSPPPLLIAVALVSSFVWKERKNSLPISIYDTCTVKLNDTHGFHTTHFKHRLQNVWIEFTPFFFALISFKVKVLGRGNYITWFPWNINNRCTTFLYVRELRVR